MDSPELYRLCRERRIPRSYLVEIKRILDGIIDDVIARYDRAGVDALKALLADDVPALALLDLSALGDEEAGHA
jgi:hypothetical protein